MSTQESTFSSNGTTPSPPSKPQVVLIHGIASHKSTMWPLAWQLRMAGFPTRCFGYASCFRGIEHHGQRFREFLGRMADQSPGGELHIVAHSLGGVVTRSALSDGCPDFVRRIVMLGTPQKGSHSATWLSRHGLGFIKSLAQVSAAPDSFVNQLPPIKTGASTEIGSIAASYDFVIPKASSHVAGEKEHIEVFSGHNGLLVRPKVGKLVVRFLEQGRFAE